MKCLNCGASVPNTGNCPNCGFDLTMQRRAITLSNTCYNKGLDKAQIRDLSGAIDLLKRSLEFNKLNIDARNLLGLVYFETGEVVSALSEWIISKNLMPSGNIASGYIETLQAEPARLDTVNTTIKKYNIALGLCRNGNEDVAVIQLKKILSQNPKLIQGYHLLALIQIKKGEFEKARKILKKAARIDKTNSTTLRFLKEVDEQTGTVTSLEPRRLFRNRKEEEPETEAENAARIQPQVYKETSLWTSLLNVSLGLIVGALLIWYLVVPSLRSSVTRQADEKVVKYTNTMAGQQTQITDLQKKIDESNNTVASANKQIEDATAQVNNNENLMKALGAYNARNLDQASKTISEVNPESLSVDAKAVYDEIYKNVQSTLFSQLSQEGQEAFDREDWAAAIDKLGKAKAINGEDYTILNYLAHAYRKSGDNAKAIENFQAIVDKFPGTKRAESAQGYIDELKGGQE